MYVQVSEMTRDNWATCGKIVKTVNFNENQIQLIIRYMTKSSHWFYVMLFYTSINSPPSYQKHLGDCTWENPRDLKFINMGSSTLYLRLPVLLLYSFAGNVRRLASKNSDRLCVRLLLRIWCKPVQMKRMKNTKSNESKYKLESILLTLLPFSQRIKATTIQIKFLKYSLRCFNILLNYQIERNFMKLWVTENELQVKMSDIYFGRVCDNMIIQLEITHLR